MAYLVEIVDSAVRDFNTLDAKSRAEVSDAIDLHLTHEPTKVSKSRIKRLRETKHPQYRLRVGEFRVFYDVNQSDQTVLILTIVGKSNATAWLSAHAEMEQPSDDNDPRTTD